MKATTSLTLAIVAAGSLLVSCSKSTETTGKTGTPPPPAAPAPAVPIDQAKEILGKLTSGIEKVVVALEAVTDKASAETAAATIKSVSAELSTLGPRANELEAKLSEAEKTAMETAAEAGMKPLMGRMTEVMQKVMTNPETADVLMPAMDAFNKAMAPPSASPQP
jgi:hypothetical protein